MPCFTLPSVRVGLQELRAKVASAQASQAEMLQRAQDICSQAEERAAGAERRAARSGAAGKGEMAAAKRAAGEREAELRQAMRDGEAKLRERIARLDEDNQELRR